MACWSVLLVWHTCCHACCERGANSSNTVAAVAISRGWSICGDQCSFTPFGFWELKRCDRVLVQGSTVYTVVCWFRATVDCLILHPFCFTPIEIWASSPGTEKPMLLCYGFGRGAEPTTAQYVRCAKHVCVPHTDSIWSNPKLAELFSSTTTT